MGLNENAHEKIQFYAALIVGIVLFYIISYSLAIIIQIPSSINTALWISAVLLSLCGIVVSFYFAHNATNTQIGKQTCLNVFLIFTICVLLFLVGNLVLELDIKLDIIKLISVIISAPLSYILAGYSIREVITKFEIFLTKNGTTIIAIVILASIPIVDIAVTSTAYIQSSGTINPREPNIKFQVTENTTFVNGQIKTSNFFAEVPVYINQTFSKEKIIQISVDNLQNTPITLEFKPTTVKGNLMYIENFELTVYSTDDLFGVVNVSDNALELHETEVSVQNGSSYYLGVVCRGSNTSISDSFLDISISISAHEKDMGKIFLKLKPE